MLAFPHPPSPLRIWAFGDAHVGTDLKHHRESLAQAIRQSEFGDDSGAPPFEWDMALDIGDNSGGQSAPEDEEGRELVRQFGALQTHRREQIYSICGNHDRSHLSEPEARWFRKWVDPTGENTAFSQVHPDRRPYPIQGTWERYAFQVGNLRFLMMSDINEPSQKLGRGDLGGNPAGVVSADTFTWWQQQVESHPDSILLTAHHYLLKNTTTATGEFEGLVKTADGQWANGYHGYKPLGAPKGASYLYFVGGVPDAQTFERYLESHPGAIDLWLGGHTHPLSPEDRAGGKSLVSTRWGVHFLNVCALTRHHVCKDFPTPPMSRRLTFTPGSDEVQVECYLHTSHFHPAGWYPPAAHTLKLSKPFQPFPVPESGPRP